MDSIWSNGIKKPSFDSLNGDIKTDVLIIGGGITGLLCGYILKNTGIDCIICEANEICSGVTRNTTAKITYHHGAVFDKMLKRFGKETAELYLSANKNALEEYRKICANISCDFKNCASFVYSRNNEQKILNELEALNKIGCLAEFSAKLPLPFKTVGAVKVANQAEFNPLKFAYSMAEGLKIYENTKVLEVISDGAITDKGRIKAEQIIVTTHFPFINKYGAYFLKMYQHRSYVIALANAAELSGMYVDEAEKGMSFRNYNNYLLIGGGGHRTGKEGGNWRELRAFTREYYPTAKEVSYWATQDCKTLDDIPYIGNYSNGIPNLFVATGFNKWGMTSSMAAAMILCDLIKGEKNLYSKVFSPKRNILRTQLVINTFETAKSLLTPTVPRCPHMGCALKYNRVEHSWDCSCHGSRFTKEGSLIDNPATDNLN